MVILVGQLAQGLQKHKSKIPNSRHILLETLLATPFPLLFKEIDFPSYSPQLLRVDLHKSRITAAAERGVGGMLLKLFFAKHQALTSVVKEARMNRNTDSVYGPAKIVCNKNIQMTQRKGFNFFQILMSLASSKLSNTGLPFSDHRTSF